MLTTKSAPASPRSSPQLLGLYPQKSAPISSLCRTCNTGSTRSSSSSREISPAPVAWIAHPLSTMSRSPQVVVPVPRQVVGVLNLPITSKTIRRYIQHLLAGVRCLTRRSVLFVHLAGAGYEFRSVIATIIDNPQNSRLQTASPTRTPSILWLVCWFHHCCWASGQSAVLNGHIRLVS